MIFGLGNRKEKRALGAQDHSPEPVVQEIKRHTHGCSNAEEKTRCVLERLTGDASLAEICRGGINANVYYRWSKDFPKADQDHM